MVIVNLKHTVTCKTYIVGSVICCYFAALLLGCGASDYEIEVVNETNQPFDFYVDALKKGSVGANSSVRFTISEGMHVFEAREGSFVLTFSSMEDVDSDIKWVVREQGI